MDYHHFIGQVQHRARVASQQDAVRAIRATFETLSERLSGSEAENLAAQLPREVGFYLRKETADAESFDLNEFFRRVGERESLEMPIAIHHARVVLGVLRDAVTPGLIDKVKAQLPDEFDRLFEPRGAEAA